MRMSRGERAQKPRERCSSTPREIEFHLSQLRARSSEIGCSVSRILGIHSRPKIAFGTLSASNGFAVVDDKIFELF